MSSSPTSPTSLTVEANRLGFPDLAFVGKAGAGKTTAAQVCCSLGYRTKSFATPLKEIAVRLWGPPAKQDRDKLQKLGVAARGIDPDVWVNLLLRDLADERLLSHAHFPTVVDDCRFENEWYALKAAGFVVVYIVATRTDRIDRLKKSGKWHNEAQLDHISETALDHIAPDHTIVNAGRRADFHDDIVNILDKERRRR